MIKSITVFNHVGDSLVLDLFNPYASGLAVKTISGLTPPTVNFSVSPLASVDGGTFGGARVDSRNIVMSLVPMAKHTIEDDRLLVYRFFPIKRKITLKVETDHRTAQIEGYVESCDADIFSNFETIQVSVVCVDPWFYETHREAQIFTGVRPMFEFPFASEPASGQLLEFGSIQPDTRADLVYNGDVDTGVRIAIRAVGKATNIAIINNRTKTKMSIDTDKIEKISGGAFDAGDEIVVDTKIGHRSAKLVRNGKTVNVLGALNRDADWFQISPGINEFTFTAATGQKNVEITFDYQNAYGGI